MIERKLTRVGGSQPTWTVHPWEADGWRVEGPEYRLDNIFVSKGIKLEEFEVLRSDISDHLPIKAVLDL
ncbi:hypothetical protein A3K63_03720 [Candidatus Micrarchaeota archaeon RBG_16_49_10]|nr:MAG: hypothetical protein A3K63_03720 [Candidatus Micrarchaeota archaeon RBG_16_49_10]